MLFVNEVIPQKDFDLEVKDILLRYKPELKNDALNSKHFSWTVNRDEQCFLFKVKTGREEFDWQLTFVLKVKNICYEFVLEKSPKSSFSLKNKPYEIYWELISSRNLDGVNQVSEYALKILKDALKVYGILGVRSPTVETSVNFLF